MLLGLVPGETVVVWAESLIENDPQAPPAIFDLALTSPRDLTALRNALQPLADKTKSAAVTRAILDRIGRQLEAGQRNLKDTVTVLSQVGRALTVSPAVFSDIDTLQDDFMLASAGVVGFLPEIEGRIRAWLAQFAGAEEALVTGTAYYIVRYDRAVEAAAFVAALSRFLDSPLGGAALAALDPAEVWATSTGRCEATTLYLNQAALEAAATAFAPVPVAGMCRGEACPRDAIMVLDGRARTAMGLTDAERSLTRS
ncbi:MAG: hypothetical protein ABI647_15980 [Gemmatimonadota bacterium]